MEAQQGEIACF